MNNAGGKDIISYSKQEVIKLTMIDIRNLTKDYGGGKGVFGVSISIKKGEVYGYLGPNGAGKSTTMRHLMGFIRSQSGTVLIDGMDCWRDQKKNTEKPRLSSGRNIFSRQHDGNGLFEIDREDEGNEELFLCRGAFGFV